MSVSLATPTLSNENAVSRIIKNSGWAANFLNGSLSQDITCTRASSGVRVSPTGTYDLVGTDIARLDFHPLLLTPRGLNVEGSRTNRIRYSAELGTPTTGDNVSATVWSVHGGSAESLTDVKFGTVFKFTENTGNGAHALISPRAAAPASDELRYSSVSIKAGTATKVAVTLKQSLMTTNSLHVKVDLANGTIIGATGYTDYGIYPEGDGWYRVKIGGMMATTDEFRSVSVQTMDGSNQTVAFDGSGRTFYYANPQSETGNIESGYIPTGSASVTRAADSVMVNTLSSIGFNASEGTFLVETEQTDVLSRNLITVFDGTTGNYMQMRLSSAARLNVGIAVGGVTTTNSTTVNDTPQRSVVRAAFAYKDGDCAACLNGGTVAAFSPSALPPVDRIRLGRSASGVDVNFAWYRRLVYYPTRLSNSHLQTITA